MSAQLPAAAPVYIRISRAPGDSSSNDSYLAWYSTDGETWRSLGGAGFDMSRTNPLYFGIAVTSHDSATMATAVTDSVRIEQ